jgi:hypothetical protein
VERELIIGAVNLARGEGCWKWGMSMYFYLSKDDEKEVDWAKDVLTLMILQKMLALTWRFVQNKLRTQENLQDKGVCLNSSTLCVEGHSKIELANH